MSLQALMSLLGHRSPEMTLRYAALASPTLRAAYDEAMGKVRRLIPVAPAGRPAVPPKVEWIASEFCLMPQDPPDRRLLLAPSRRRRMPLRQRL